MHLALDKNDFGAQNLLRWFIDEQLEEEATVSAIVDRLRRVHDDPHGLMQIDNELGKRSGTAL